MIILGISIALCLFVLGGLWSVSVKSKRWYLLALLPLLLCVTNFFTYIPANTVGVQYSPFTGVKDQTLSEGLKLKGFFDKVYKISTEVQTKTVEGIIGQTKDAQYITIALDIKYKVDTTNAFNVFRQYRTLENVDKTLIIPIAQRSVEAVTTQYDIIEILGNKRNEVYQGIEDELRQRLTEDGIDLRHVVMTDTDAGDAIEKAIQDEAVAKKEVETAEQYREKARIESEQKLIEAEAQAKAKIIEAEGNAKAYKVENKELTPEVLNKIWIDKWDGKLPQVLGNEQGIMLDIAGEE